jgi:hypothetical protein
LNTVLYLLATLEGIMSRNMFWLANEQWAKIAPLLPTDVRGKARVDDRRVLSGILPVLNSGCRWYDCPPEYGPPTTIYNRFVRRAQRGVRENGVRGIVTSGPLGGGWKSGEQNQAIGRSRGGRNTKIHAIADAKGISFPSC